MEKNSLIKTYLYAIYNMAVFVSTSLVVIIITDELAWWQGIINFSKTIEQNRFL